MLLATGWSLKTGKRHFQESTDEWYCKLFGGQGVAAVGPPDGKSRCTSASLGLKFSEAVA
jgi:hypothetical protein